MRKIFFALLATAAFAMAESHTHDGFFLNLALGFGHQSFDYEANKAPYDLEASGMSGEFDIKLGGRIATNTLLHASILGITNNEDLDIKSQDGYEIGSTSGQNENMTILGIGVTYYFPMNVFFSGTIGMAQFTLQNSDSENDRAEGSTDTGLGFQLAVGKEWWVSDNWGLGVSAAFTYGSAEDKNDAGDASAYGINVMFSATFN